MPPVSAILLAAGQSRRMGRCKQLLPLPDRPAVVRCVESLLSAQVDEVIVVIGSEGEAVGRAVEDFPVAVVRNETPQSDMASSVRAGLTAVGGAAEGVFVCLCDHPLVSPATLVALRTRWLTNRKAIMIPRHMGRRGHPPLFPRRILEEIQWLPTLRDVIGRQDQPVSYLDVADPGTVLDMDTWADYRDLLERCRAGESAHPGNPPIE